jgi:AcrR family transcriptional regulator
VVPYSAVAAEAGVGIATLYRHFPTPDDLIEGLARDIAAQIRDICARRLEEMGTDPAAGWTGFAGDIAALRLGILFPHLFRGLSTDTLPRSIHDLREETFGAIDTVVDAARSAGLVRHDASTLQIHLGLSLLTRPTPEIVDQLVPGLTDWLIDVFLRGLRP